MKRLSIIVATLFIMVCTFGQTRIAVKAGPNFGTARVTLNEANQTTSYKPGLSFAVQAKVPFDGVLHFSPYVGYTLRAFKTKYTNGNTIENSIHYLTLCPNFSLDFVAAKDRNVVVGFGPVLGITKFGREKITTAGSTLSRNMKFGYGDYGWFDLGVTGSLGFEIKRFFIEGTYYLGLANINNAIEQDGINIRQRTLGLNIGYFLR